MRQHAKTCHRLQKPHNFRPQMVNRGGTHPFLSAETFMTARRNLRMVSGSAGNRHAAS